MAFLEANNNNRYNTEDFSSTIKFLGALYKTINKDTSLNDGAVLISTIIDIVKESVQIADDIDAGEKSANEIKKSAVKLVSKYTTALDKLTKLTNHKTSFLLIGAAAVALSANFITSLDISTDEEARAQLSSLLKDEVNLAKEVLNTCIKNFFSDDLSSSLFNGKITDNNITAPLGSIALASSAFTGIISGVMTFFDEVEHYKEDGIPEDIAIKDAIITAAATAIKETASKYTKGFDDVAFKVIQDFMSFVTQNEVDELFADKSYTELIVENFKTFNYTNTGTADDNELVSYENGKMIYGYDGNDYIGNIASNVTIFGGHDNDTIFSRKGSGADYSTPQANSILGGPGNDWLIAYDIKSSVYGGTGDDRIAVYGTKNKIFGEDGKDAILFGDGADNNTANGGLGDDVIILESVKNAVLEYAEGDGNDIVLGYDESDIISITGEYSTQTSGADVIIVVGTDSIILNEAAGKTININNKRSVIGESPEGGTTTFTTLPSIWNDGVKIIRGTNGDDTIDNEFVDNVIIYGLNGNDIIYTNGDNIAVNAGVGDDYISNSWGDSVTISSGDGNDSIYNYGDSVTIDASTGNDSVHNRGTNVTINTGAGNDSVYNQGASVTIDAGDGNNYVSNYGDSVTIDAGDGNDSIKNTFGQNLSINGGSGDDYIETGVSFNGDWMQNYSSYVSITGGFGNDTIKLNYYEQNTLIQYNDGDGNDQIEIEGFCETATFSISGASYSSVTSGNDIIVKVGDGSITLKNFASSSSSPWGTLNIIGTYASDTTPPDTTPASTTLTVTNADKSPVTLESSIEVVDASTRTKAVKIFGNALDNTITGGTGNDTFSGGDGADTFIMSGGKDVIIDYSSEDVIQVTKNVSATFKGNDVIFTVDKNNSLTVKDGAKGQTITLVDEQGETISANTYYADRMVDDDSVILGANFKGKTFKPEDNICKVDGSALKGKLNLTGNDFDDTLIGGNGADTLNGGAGNDELTGGGGKNIFVYTGGADTITDYKSGKDKISLASGLSIQGVEKVEDGGFMVEFGEDTSLQIDNITRTTKVSLVTTTTVKDKSKAVTATVYFDEGRIFDKPTDIASTKVTVMGGEADFSDDGNYKKLKTITAAENLDGLEIYGNKNANSIVGSAGDDSLWGGDGNDTLCGGDGEDTFIYQISKKSGKETIVDYQDNELLEILDADGNAVDFKNATYGKNKLTLTLENKGSIILTGITSETALNINGETYHVDGKTLSK